jgi:hypothetical protein
VISVGQANDRRWSERQPRELAVTLHVAGQAPVTATTRDISIGGLFVRMPTGSLAPDGQVRVVFTNGLLAERHRTGEQLRESEARFEATFEQAAVGIAMVAPDGRWLRVNRKLCEIVGYRQEELLARRFQDITHPDDLDADLEYVRRMLAGEIGNYSMEKRYLRKDGGIVWINLTVALARKRDGAPDYFISVVEDIQARKQAEAALKESAANLKEAQRLAGIGNWRWDVRSDVHTWSEEIYRMYGRDPALPPATYPEVQKYFTPESWARLAAAVEKGLAEGVPYECDAEVVRPDGSHRWITARGEATRDADGNVVNLFGTVQDITERKRAEEQAARQQEELARVTRLAMLNALCSGIAHDISQPLTAITSQAQGCSLRLRAGSSDSKALLGAIERIVEQAQRAGEIIQNVRSFIAKREPLRAATDINELVKRSVPLIADDLRANSVVLSLELAPDLPTAQVNGIKIQQVVLNLLRNAVEAMSGVEAASRTLAVHTATNENGDVAVTVSDTGPGLAPEQLKRVFEPFYTTKSDGMGMGLAICHSIIEAHGGELRAMPHAPRGMSFQFTLPVEHDGRAD